MLGSLLAVSTPTYSSPVVLKPGESQKVALQHTLDGGRINESPVTVTMGIENDSLQFVFDVEGTNENIPLLARDQISLFESTAVEVFVSAADNPEDGYYHFAVNGSGSLYDEAVMDSGWTRLPEWNAPVNVKKLPSSAEGRWSVSMSVPIATFRRVTPDQLPRDLPQELWIQIAAVTFEEDTPPLAITWSPTTSSFHSPENFGKLQLVDVPLDYRASVSSEIRYESDQVSIESSVITTVGDKEIYRVTGNLAGGDQDLREETLFETNLSYDNSQFLSQHDPNELRKAQYLMTRLYDSDGIFQDQSLRDWIFTTESPVTVTHERFRDALSISVSETTNYNVENLFVSQGDQNGPVVWRASADQSRGDHQVDTAQWDAGIYSLQWGEPGNEEVISVLKLPAETLQVPMGWAFWGYKPDEELLAEFEAFDRLTDSNHNIAGYIYGGSVDPATGALSRLDLEGLREWKKALPRGEFHLMIDGGGNFDLVTDEQVAVIAERFVSELMPIDEVDGLHFDLEPYRPSQIRLTREMTRLGWTKSLSLAAGLATTIPEEQWSSVDYIAVMNYDLAKTPEAYTQRATNNARVFAQAAARNDSKILLGIPVIATHYENTMIIEASTGELVSGSMDDTMVPFVDSSLEILWNLQNDSEVSSSIGAPILWGALSRRHHVGQKEYRYFPNTITGPVWQRLVEFEKARP